jgi:hypothetical protein
VRWVARSVGEARGHARRVPTDPFADRGPRGWVPGGWHVGIVEESVVYTLCAIAAEVKTDPIAAASLAESRRLVCETWVSLVCGTWVSHTRGSKSGTHGTLSRAAPYGLAHVLKNARRVCWSAAPELTSSAGAGAEVVLVAASNKVAKLVEQLAYQRVLPELRNGPHGGAPRAVEWGGVEGGGRGAYVYAGADNGWCGIIESTMHCGRIRMHPSSSVRQ